jgi:predicted transcriptional regulator
MACPQLRVSKSFGRKGRILKIRTREPDAVTQAELAEKMILLRRK